MKNKDNRPEDAAELCRRADEALRQSEERHRIVLQTAMDGFWRADMQGRLIEVNAAYCRMSGYSAQELLTMRISDLEVAETEDDTAGHIHKVVAQGEDRFESRHRRKDGSIFDVEVSVQYQAIEGGRLIAFLRDITERKQAEAALRASEARVQKKLQSILSPVDDIGPLELADMIDVGAIQHLMDKFYQLTRVPNSIIDLKGNVLVGTGWQDICTKFHRLHPETLSHCIECDTLLSTGVLPGTFKTYLCQNNLWDCVTPLMVGCKHVGNLFTGQFFFEGERPDDSVFRAQAAEYGFDESDYMAAVGRIPVWNRETINVAFEFYTTLANMITSLSHGNIALVRLLEEQKRAEEALRDSEERHRKIVEASSDAFLLRSGEVVIYANPAALKLFRANHPEDLIGKQYLDLVHPDDRALSAERVKKNLYENWIASPREHRLLALDGQVVHVESTGVPVKYRDETQVFGVFRDITERKRAEEEKAKLEAQLQQTQKMEAIGTLAGGIAHDFNNILSVIIGHAEVLNFEDDIGTSTRNSLNQILAASQRAKQLVHQILAFSRHGKQEKILISLKPITKESLEFLRASLPSLIELRHYLEPDAGTVMADPTQMQQVLMNLCVNAAHAMEKDGGVLQIKLTNTTLTEEDTRLDPEVEPGDFVKLTVSDTGHGMEPSVLQRIFDPYFTTKEPGKGTGLGLAVVHGIVKSHGGMIKVDSKVGKGTTFAIFLPRAMGFEKVKDTPLQPLAMGTEKILFVDDESALADLGQQLLGELGYQVETRTSPIEALEAFRANPHKFDLVVTDLTMPQMSGLNLARKIMEIRPGMLIILCTGFSEQANEHAAAALGIRAFLLKPLVMRDMAAAVRKVLDA
jgi:PAS domain S-box-containing protein